MATLRNKRKLAVLNKENCEEHPRRNLAQKSNVPRSQGDYITQVFEEVEGRVTKKLSQEFSMTENRKLDALARLDNFLMYPLIECHSGTARETSQNAFSTNQGSNEDDSHSDPNPEAGTFANQTMRNSGQEDQRDIVHSFSHRLYQTREISPLFRFVFFILFLIFTCINLINMTLDFHTEIQKGWLVC